MTRHLSVAAIALLTITSLAGPWGCGGNPVGRPCYIGADASVPNEAIVASPALECQSRTCLHWPNNKQDLCTDKCETEDDCEKVPESPCEKGFACTVPVVVGPFCCRKMCVCKDYLPEDYTNSTPGACDPSNPINECCNLSGRRGSSAYPMCN